MRVLFVCMGNICRSPTAEGMLHKQLIGTDLGDWVQVDSAGTHDYHIGEPPDRRAMAAALRRNVDISGLRARQVSSEDFAHFDLLLAMDRDNLAQLIRVAPTQYKQRVRLYLEFAPQLSIREVPDPYYGNERDFETVLNLVELAGLGLLQHIRKLV